MRNMLLSICSTGVCIVITVLLYVAFALSSPFIIVGGLLTGMTPYKSLKKCFKGFEDVVDDCLYSSGNEERNENVGITSNVGFDLDINTKKRRGKK